MRLPLLLLSPLFASALGYYDFNGFRYQLADSAVDSDGVDLFGDDCATFPCTSFAVPSTCNMSFPTGDLTTVALSKGWSTSYLAAVDGFYPTADWILSPAAYSIVDTSTPGFVALNDAGWRARIILRCKIPCPAGSILVGSACSACPVGTWSPYWGTVCLPCTNAPASSVYTSNGADSSNCSYSCGVGTYLQPMPSPFLYIGDSFSVRAVDPTGRVSTVYRPRPSDLTYGATYMVASALNRNWIYTGTAAVNRLDLSNGSIVTVAGSSLRGVSDGTGTAATFNSLVGGALWQNEAYLLVLDGMNCNLRQIDLATRAVTTVLGNGCAFQEGIGGKIRSPTDIVINAAQDTAYIADSGNYRIRAVVLATMSLSTLVGNGVGSNTDGTGAAATVDPRYLALSSDQTILYVKTISTLRKVVIATGVMSTLPPSTLGLSAYQISASQLNANIVYYAAIYSVNTLVITSGQSTLIAGSGTPSQADGRGSLAGFLGPNFMALVNETLSTNVCAACAVCPASQYSVCNATASMCVTCGLGTFTASAGFTACANCPAGQYGVPGGSCVSCPVGMYSAAGATVCANCSAGTYLTGQRCANCTGGTYSLVGATACSLCANLIGNATYLANQPGTNATNCPLACRAGFTFSPGANACSQCSLGQWSAAGSTTCSDCNTVPANASFSGVGTSASNCPFTCNAGFYASGGACVACMPGTMLMLGACAPCPIGTYSGTAASNCTTCPPGYYALAGSSNCTACPAGTRILAGVCTACLASSYSGANATACVGCAVGYYSYNGATACTACPNQNSYTVFLGRSASPSCPFYCLSGSFLLNRTVCTACANGTYTATIGATRCLNCAAGRWSGAGSTVCTTCSSLLITASNGSGVADYPYVSKASWGITSVVCVP